ncbi:MAG: beta-N-acetylhexosaminidase [Gammaproteobacteria bacterium]
MTGRVIIDVAGLTLDDSEAKLVSDPMVAGVIFFARNYESPEQIQALIAQLRSIREDIILCVDQEGGRVQRFRTGVTRLPPVGVLRQAYQACPEQALKDAEQLGWLMASEMLALGIDLSFAPVLDVDYGNHVIIGDRSFGVTAADVTALAGAYVRGMHRAGMATVGKHFPGHGYVALDSHESLPYDARPLVAVEADMAPYVELIDQLDAVMTAHIVYTQADDQAASFSPYWIEQQLRARLGFRGVVISDDLHMRGAWQAGDPSVRALKALQAGCDVLLYCNDPAGVQVVLNTLTQAGVSDATDLSVLRRAGTASWKHFAPGAARQQALNALRAYMDVST